MNKTKKKIVSFLALFFLVIQFSPLALHSSDDLFFFDEEDLGFDLSDLEENTLFRSSSSINAGNLAEIATYLDSGNFLNQPLWKSTRAPKSRNVLYLFPNTDAFKQKKAFDSKIFFSMTHKMPVSADTLINFAGINTTNLVQFLSDGITNGLITNIKSANEIPLIFPILQKATIQEHKIGSLLQTSFNIAPFCIRLETSLQLSERNFWLDQKDRDELDALYSAIYSEPSAPLEISEFYRLNGGFGDSRIKMEFNIFNNSTIKLNGGIAGIIPTSILSTGKKYKNTPDALLSDLNALQESAVNTLYNTRDYLLYPDLGNGGHFGLGLYLNSKIKLPEEIGSLHFTISYDSFLPANETRMILHKTTMTTSDISTDMSNPDLIITSFNEFIKQYIMPDSIDVTIQPGSIFNSSTSIIVPLDFLKTTWTFGYNFYMQNEESFNQLNNTTISKDSLRINDAKTLAAHQHQLFTNFTHMKDYNTYSINYGIGSSLAVSSKNLGNDWSIYLHIGASF